MIRVVARLALGLLLGLAPCACSIPFTDDDTEAQNRCSSDGDCLDGAACVDVNATIGAVCGVTSADLGAVVLEVRSTTAQGDTASFVFTDALALSGAIAGGVVPEVDLELPPAAAFTGRYFADPATPPECAASDGSVPATVTLRNTSSLGVFTTELSGQTVAEAGAGGAIASQRFTVDAPLGTYDVYIAPQAQGEDCDVPPPRLFRGVEIPKDVANVEFTPPLDAPLRLGGTMFVPQNVALEGWVLEIVDPTYGRVVSESPSLASAAPGVAEIPILGGDGSPEGLRYYYTADALLRLRDTEGQLAVHWALAALDFNGDGVVELDLRDLVATPMPLEGTIIDAAGKLVSGAHVTIRSISLTGDANNNAVYRADAESDAAGTIRVQLVPGTYAVTIVPSSTPGAATLYSEWIVTESGGNGKGFELQAQPVISGALSIPGGGVVGFTPVVVTPSQPDTTSYFSHALGPPQASVRQLSTLVDANGEFDLPVDAGTLDLGVQIDATSAYPWVVIPRLLVLPADQQPIHDLGALQVSNPVVVRGGVTSSGGAVPLAVVRAWLAADPAMGASDAPPLVQIGETVTDEAGRFFLPLPPSIKLPAATPAP